MRPKPQSLQDTVFNFSPVLPSLLAMVCTNCPLQPGQAVRAFNEMPVLILEGELECIFKF